jgi:hypothetical protein
LVYPVNHPWVNHHAAAAREANDWSRASEARACSPLRQGKGKGEDDDDEDEVAGLGWTGGGGNCQGVYASASDILVLVLIYIFGRKQNRNAVICCRGLCSAAFSL